MINKTWMIYFLIMNMIMTSVVCLNNQTSTKIIPIQVINTINHSFKIPFIIKIWIFQQILRFF